MKAINQLSNSEQKMLSIRIRKECIKQMEAYDLNLDTLIVYTLHTEFGFGQKRINKFYERMGKLRKELKAHYSSDNERADDSFYYAMREQLKRDGIDISEVERKVDQMTM